MILSTELAAAFVTQMFPEISMATPLPPAEVLPCVVETIAPVLVKTTVEPLPFATTMWLYQSIARAVAPLRPRLV